MGPGQHVTAVLPDVQRHAALGMNIHQTIQHPPYQDCPYVHLLVTQGYITLNGPGLQPSTLCWSTMLYKSTALMGYIGPH